jgi:hypothetical protein
MIPPAWQTFAASTGFQKLASGGSAKRRLWMNLAFEVQSWLLAAA